MKNEALILKALRAICIAVENQNTDSQRVIPHVVYELDEALFELEVSEDD